MQVLVVDGDGGESEAIRQFLESSGIDVGTSGTYPDFIVVSVFGESCPKRCSDVRSQYGKAPFVLAVLSDDTPVDLQALLEAGVDDCVHGLDDLRMRLAFLLRRSNDQARRERRLKAVLETTVDGVIVIDQNGTVESFNPAAERIFGYEASEVTGQNIRMLMPEPYKEEHDAYIGNYVRTGRAKIIGIGREVVGRRKDGTTFPMELAVSEVQSDSGRTFAGIVRDISDRRRLENEILRISDQERRRIGQDLHDGLGQMLTGIGLISQNMTRKVSEELPELAEDMAEITDLIREADQQARSLARGLVPVELDVNGLAAAIQRLCTNAERLFGIDCTFEEIGEEPVRETTAAINLYRIAQEAVSNAVKHGRASGVRVTLASGREQVRLRIQDNGVGFPDELGPDRGMGVRIMHYRARVIGALLEIRRRSQGGTLLTCTLPRRSTAPAVAHAKTSDHKAVAQ